MELWGCHFMAFYPGWTSKGYSMEFHGTLESPIKNHRVPWDSVELWEYHFKWHKYSMEFHGIFHGIPWTSGAAKWNIPWNYMELWCRRMKYHLVPWNSMELWDCHFITFYPGWTSNGYSMEFHGTLESPNKKSPSSMELWEHHFKWHKYSMEFHGIFHGIPWNSGAAKWNIN